MLALCASATRGGRLPPRGASSRVVGQVAKRESGQLSHEAPQGIRQDMHGRYFEGLRPLYVGGIRPLQTFIPQFDRVNLPCVI